MSHRRFLLFLVFCVACKPAPKQTAATDTVPKIAATVVTIRTTIQPGDRVSSHEIVIANNRARSTQERDVWRLFDTKARTVTFVDEVAKTVRTESIESLTKSRRTALAAAIPAHYPRATLTPGGTRAILGATAQQHLIEVGAYRRELWIAGHKSIPDELFALMSASDPPSSPLAPMMRQVDAALLEVKGFPFVDRSEVPLGKTKSIVEHAVTGIASRQMPEAMLEVPRGYRDVTPKPASAKPSARKGAPK